MRLFISLLLPLSLSPSTNLQQWKLVIHSLVMLKFYSRSRILLAVESGFSLLIMSRYWSKSWTSVLTALANRVTAHVRRRLEGSNQACHRLTAVLPSSGALLKTTDTSRLGQTLWGKCVLCFLAGCCSAVRFLTNYKDQ